MSRADAVWDVGRVTVQPVGEAGRAACASTAWSACRGRAASCSPSTTSAGSIRLRSARRARARSTTWRRSRPTAIPGLGQLIRQLRHVQRAPRRVRPRGRAPHAPGRAERATRSASSSRGRGSAAASPAACSPGRRWSPSRRACRSSRPRSTARRPGASATGIRCSVAWGEPFTLDGLPRGGKGYREGIARRSSGGSGGSGTGSSRSTRSADPAAPSRPHERGAGARRHGGDRRLPERRQVDADQPADPDARRRRPRDARGHARPQGAPLPTGTACTSASSTPAASTSLGEGAVRPGRSPSRPGPRSGRPTSCCSSSTRAPASRPATRSSPRSCASRRSPCSCSRTSSTTHGATREALEFHRLGLGDPIPLSALHGHGTGDLLDEVVARLPGGGVAAVGEEAIRVAILGPDERGQVVAPERARRPGARDRVRRPGHDARRDRHRAAARRHDVRAGRHGRATAQAPAAPGHRVLQRAARARGGRARRRRARAGRRERGHRRAGPLRGRRGAQGGLLDPRRALEVGHRRA